MSHSVSLLLFSGSDVSVMGDVSFWWWWWVIGAGGIMPFSDDGVSLSDLERKKEEGRKETGHCSLCTFENKRKACVWHACS